MARKSGKAASQAATPTAAPTELPTEQPTEQPTELPTEQPTELPAAAQREAAPSNPDVAPQSISLTEKPTASAPEPSGNKLPGIRNIVAVASGKGGVGKSTVAVNLAIALSQSGSRVGLVDADILGPSIPVMLGLDVNELPLATADGRMVPPERYGVKAASMGLLRNDDNPAILRGPMVSKYLQMLVAQVDWGQLDYLILDLPPGTGDTQLTLAQSLQLSGVVIVTTPQDVSLKIARRGLRMFETVNVPILGIVENMSTFTCPHCSTDTDVFGRGGGEHMSAELDVAFLGAIPLDADIVTGGDGGHPLSLNDPNPSPPGPTATLPTPSTPTSRASPPRCLARSLGRGTPTRAHPDGSTPRPPPTVHPQHPLGSPNATGPRCRCCGKTAATMTSMSVTSALPADAQHASKR